MNDIGFARLSAHVHMRFIGYPEGFIYQFPVSWFIAPVEIVDQGIIFSLDPLKILLIKKILLPHKLPLQIKRQLQI